MFTICDNKPELGDAFFSEEVLVSAGMSHPIVIYPNLTMKFSRIFPLVLIVIALLAAWYCLSCCRAGKKVAGAEHGEKAAPVTTVITTSREVPARLSRPGTGHAFDKLG
jgi:hypothetical protein